MRFFTLPVIRIKRGLHDHTFRKNKAPILIDPGDDVKPDASSPASGKAIIRQY